MRKPYKRIKQEEKERIIALHQEGKTIQQIANALGRSYAAIQYQLGAPKKRIFQFKVFTPEEIALIEECYDTGGNITMLAKKIGCNPNTIYSWARKKGLMRKQKIIKRDPDLERKLDAALMEVMTPQENVWGFERL